MTEYVWIVYEIIGNRRYLFGVFSTESRQIEACKQFNDSDDYAVEKIRLDP
jgi:hypothetical protein